MALGPITPRWLWDFQRDMRNSSQWGLCTVRDDALVWADTGQRVGALGVSPVDALLDLLGGGAHEPTSILIVDPAVKPFPSMLAKTEDATYKYNSEGAAIGLYDVVTSETSATASVTILRSDCVPNGRVCWPAVLIHTSNETAWGGVAAPLIRHLLRLEPLQWHIPKGLDCKVVRVDESVRIAPEGSAAFQVQQTPQSIILEPSGSGGALILHEHVSPMSIVIPTGFGRSSGGTSLLEDCLDHLVGQAPLHEHDEIIVVGCTKGRERTLSLLRDRIPQIAFIEDSPDFNFSRRVNLGVSHARNDVIALVNDDVTVSLATLRMLAQTLSEGYVASAPLLVDPSRTLIRSAGDTSDHAGPRHLFRGWPIHRYRAFPWAKGTREVGLLSAACMVFLRRQFMSVGGFSLHLPKDFGDSDFSLKLRASGGRLGLVQDLSVAHIEGASKPQPIGTDDFVAFSGLWRDIDSLDTTWIWGDLDRLGERAS